MEEIMKLLQPGLKLLESELKKGKPDFEKQVNLMISLPTLTGKEWETSHGRMMKAIREEPVEKHSFEDSSLPKQTEEELNKKLKYAYVMLSYRIDDAQ